MPYADPEKKRANAREYARRRYAKDPEAAAARMKAWRESDPSGRNHSYYVPIGPEGRFWKLVDRSDETGCWLWVGKRDHNGYGRFTVERKTWAAHRYSWLLHRGEDPGRAVVRHLVCDNPPCVNPAHLAIGTQQDNIKDMHAKGRGRGPGHATASVAA
jgi:hypothetical protein